MRGLAAAVAGALLLIGCSGCVCACGECAFLPAVAAGGVVRATQVNAERVPIRNDLAVVLKGEPEPTAPAWPGYQDAAERLGRDGRRANEVIGEEHWRSWRKPRLLAARDYPTVLRFTGRADPHGSRSNAEWMRRTIEWLLDPAHATNDGDSPSLRPPRPVPADVVPRLLARRDELDQLIQELIPHDPVDRPPSEESVAGQAAADATADAIPWPAPSP
jgi:hypothetical protein